MITSLPATPSCLHHHCGRAKHLISSHSPPRSVKIFKNPVFVLQLLAPFLRAGFVQRALHKNTLARKTREHRRLVQRISDKQGSNAMHICKSFYSQMVWADEETVRGVTQDVALIVGEGDKMMPPEYTISLGNMLK